MRSFALALGLVFAASATQAKPWVPDYGLWDATNRPIPVKLSAGLAFRQCTELLRQGASKIFGFRAACKSPSQIAETVMICTPDPEGDGSHHCFLTGSGPRPD